MHSRAACTVAAIQGKAPKGTTITGAEMVAAAGRVPAHCRVDGHATSSGNDVNFRLALPEGWNGKFCFSASAVSAERSRISPAA